MSRKGFLVVIGLLLLTLVLAACSATLPEGCPPDCAGKDMYQIKLGKVDLSSADLTGTDLSRANLVGANLRGATLVDAGLRYADLRDADLTGADLSGADMRFARLKGVNFTDANLEGTNLLLATHRPSTIWPEGFDYKAAGAVLAQEDFGR